MDLVRFGNIGKTIEDNEVMCISYVAYFSLEMFVEFGQNNEIHRQLGWFIYYQRKTTKKHWIPNKLHVPFTRKAYQTDR